MANDINDEPAVPSRRLTLADLALLIAATAIEPGGSWVSSPSCPASPSG